MLHIRSVIGTIWRATLHEKPNDEDDKDYEDRENSILAASPDFAAESGILTRFLADQCIF